MKKKGVNVTLLNGGEKGGDVVLGLIIVLFCSALSFSLSLVTYTHLYVSLTPLLNTLPTRSTKHTVALGGSEELADHPSTIR